MLNKTPWNVPKDTFDTAILNLPKIDFKFTLNKPTGRFLYDPWVIKEEFKNTVWEDILNTLPVDIGEARLIILTPGTSYSSHADIDDRYHLNLTSTHSYLIDLDNKEMHDIVCDRTWYYMDAGRRHTAANFGYSDRIQLVVRQPLLDNVLADPVLLKLTSTLNPDRSRFVFDDIISPWLNKANKTGKINSFKQDGVSVSFNIERSCIDELKSILPTEFTAHE
jgi:hypothetical protein